MHLVKHGQPRKGVRENSLSLLLTSSFGILVCLSPPLANRRRRVRRRPARRGGEEEGGGDFAGEIGREESAEGGQQGRRRPAESGNRRRRSVNKQHISLQQLFFPAHGRGKLFSRPSRPLFRSIGGRRGRENVPRGLEMAKSHPLPPFRTPWRPSTARRRQSSRRWESCRRGRRRRTRTRRREISH